MITNMNEHDWHDHHDDDIFFFFPPLMTSLQISSFLVTFLVIILVHDYLILTHILLLFLRQKSYLFLYLVGETHPQTLYFYCFIYSFNFFFFYNFLFI